MFDTPILLLIFNRPEQTQKVFDAIRLRQPKFFYIAADGPRPHHPADEKLTMQCRQIVSDVDWPCEIKTLFRASNLGCGAAPAEAISWFFDQVDEGIILEDDCLPSESFFDYCTALLQKYRNDQQIMAVCGTSYQPRPLDHYSYYFSKYIHVWGWASWKRAWQRYRFQLSEESMVTRKAVIDKMFANPRERRMWVHNMMLIENGLDAWDYQFMYWTWKNDGLAIIPWENMVSNIGFGTLATHTRNHQSEQANMPRHDIAVIKHPEKVKAHLKADRYERFHILIESPYTLYKNRLKSVIRRLFKLFRLEHG